MEKIRISSLRPDGEMTTEEFASTLQLSSDEKMEYIRLQKILDKPWQTGENAKWREVSTADEYNEAFMRKTQLLNKASTYRASLEEHLIQSGQLDWEIQGNLLDPWDGPSTFKVHIF